MPPYIHSFKFTKCEILPDNAVKHLADFIACECIPAGECAGA